MTRILFLVGVFIAFNAAAVNDPSIIECKATYTYLHPYVINKRPREDTMNMTDYSQWQRSFRERRHGEVMKGDAVLKNPEKPASKKLKPKLKNKDT